MKFTEGQCKFMWGIVCDTQTIPRNLGGLRPKDRQHLVNQIKAQQGRLQEKARKLKSMLDEDDGPEYVEIGNHRYRREDSSPGANYSKFAEGLVNQGIREAADRVVDEVKQGMGESADNTADGLQRAALASRSHRVREDSYYYSNTTVTVPVDTGETDGNQQHSVSEDDDGSEGSGQEAGRDQREGGSGDGSTEPAEPKAAYDW